VRQVGYLQRLKGMFIRTWPILFDYPKNN